MAKVPQLIKDSPVTYVPGSVFENETVRKEKVSNAARKIEFEIGDIMQPDFYPQFKTKHWDNEVNFSARLVTNAGTVTENEGKIAYDDGEKIARFYEKDTGDEDGGFEFDVVLPSKPTSNVLTWTIQHKDLDFFYQPPLTQEEIDEGATRPENVEGSYAVYHKTKKNNTVGGKEYRTGKAFHIYRPYAEDANGDRVWADLNIDTTTNEMTVTIPRQWLNKAAYPVVVDPTFGYTTAGGSFSNTSAKNACKYTSPSESGDITKFTFYSNNTAASDPYTAHVAMYSDSSGSPSSLLVSGTSGQTIANNSPQWYDFTASYTFSASTAYWLTSWHENSIFVKYYYDAGATDQRKYGSSGTYPTWPSTFGSITGAHARQISIYATYTAGGGSSPSSSPSPSVSSSPSPSVSSSPSSSPSPSVSSSPSSSVSSSPSPSVSSSPSSSPSTSPSPSVSSSPSSSPSPSESSSPSPSVSSSPSPSVSSSPSPSVSSSPSPSVSSSPSSSVSSSPSESSSPSSSPSAGSSPSSSPSPSVSSSPSPSVSSSPSSSPSTSESASPSSSPSPSVSSSPSPSVSSSPSASVPPASAIYYHNGTMWVELTNEG